jgi:hypothetical protein
MENLASVGPITLLHLQLGRASIKIPEVRFDLSPSLTKRLHYLEEIKKEFWKKWMAKVFPGPSAGPKVEKVAPRHPGGQRGASEDLVKTAAGVEFQRGTVDPPRY